MAASSAGRLRRDNVTLTFDPLTPKPNQLIQQHITYRTGLLECLGSPV